jgi:phosphocarrier protein
VQAVQKYRCEVLVAKGEMEVNGKSLMGLMMLAAEHGARIKITLTGPEAPQAMAEVERLFARNFDED